MPKKNPDHYRPRKVDLYKVAYPLARRAINSRFNRIIEGAENIPDEPVILAANHDRFWDSISMAVTYTELAHNPLRFGAKQEYFEGKGINDDGKWGRALKFGMLHTRQFPVDREGKDPRAFIKLEKAVKVRMDHGDSVAFHPEGTRPNNKKLNKFKSGAGRIAVNLNRPVVPTGLVYTDFSNGAKSDLRIIFGEPIYTSNYHLNMPPRKRAEHLMQEVEDRVADLTGMEQSGFFAELTKKTRSHGSPREQLE